MKHEPVGRSIGGEMLLRRLQAVSPLTPAQAQLVRSIQNKARGHDAGSQISPDGEGRPVPRLIASGWACRPRIMPDGRCQMLSILLPGDIIGDVGEHRPLSLAPVVALTAVRTVSIKSIYDAIGHQPQEYGRLSEMLAELNRQEEGQLLDHVVRLGCQTALQRVAHCLTELYHRCQTIGFVHGDSFPMPLTQVVMGESLGLSLVHVNRTMTQLKRGGFIQVKGGMVAIINLSGLSLLADFSPPEPWEGRAAEWPLARRA